MHSSKFKNALIKETGSKLLEVIIQIAKYKGREEVAQLHLFFLFVCKNTLLQIIILH